MATPQELESENIVFFDGVCSLCNAFVDFLIARDKNKTFRYAPLQGHTAQARLPLSRVKLASVVYIKNGLMLTQSNAALQILADLGGLWSLVSLLKVVPQSLRDSVYSIIATNRYKWFGRRETCRLPSKEERARFLD